MFACGEVMFPRIYMGIQAHCEHCLPRANLDKLGLKECFYSEPLFSQGGGMEGYISIGVALVSLVVAPAIGRASDAADPGVFSSKANRILAIAIHLGFQAFIAFFSFYSSRPLSPQQYLFLSLSFSACFVLFGLFAVLSVFWKCGSIDGIFSWRYPNLDYLYRPERHISLLNRSDVITPDSSDLLSETERSKMTRRMSFIKLIDAEDLTPATTPLLARDSNSQLRAKGMQSFYNNWKQCYFSLGSPFGQSVETEVELVPDPDNRFDKNAVAVLCEGVVLGYIPTELALSLKTLINSVGGVVRADAELWFDSRTRTAKRNSVRLLVVQPFRVQGY